jgi:acetylornithine deacetylase/succinyl-diaminopimelate desuccinylase-like protein
MPGLRSSLPFAALLVLAPAASLAAPLDLDALAARVRTLVEALVAADTENPPGNEARAVAVGAARLRAEGISFETFEFAPGRSNLIVRLKGDGTEKPLLLLAHIDVVPTAAQPWTVPTHQVTVKGDRLYGRGVYDDLPMAAAELEVAILLAKARVPLRRDVIVAWTGGEETAGDGIRWQLANRPGAIVDAGLVLNEGGNFRLGPDGKPSRAGFLVAEKGYQDFAVRVKGAGGHSSAPRPGNAIVRLARALDRIDRSPFPPRLVPAARTWFGEAARSETGAIADAMNAIASSKETVPSDAIASLAGRPAVVALLRTTCVPTQVSGGTSRNVLPASASANVNCRILPGETTEDVQKALARVVADPEVEIVPDGKFTTSSDSPLEGEGPSAIRAVMARRYPGLPVLPFLANYFTDSTFLRPLGIPAYGLGLFPVTDEDLLGVHGPDERIPVASIREGAETLYELVVELAARR